MSVFLRSPATVLHQSLAAATAAALKLPFPVSRVRGAGLAWPTAPLPLPFRGRRRVQHYSQGSGDGAVAHRRPPPQATESQEGALEPAGPGQSCSAAETPATVSWRSPDPWKLFVHNVAYEATEHAVVEFFGQFGTVERAYLRRNHSDGTGHGFAFVAFADQASLQRALKDANGAVFMGRRICVEPYMSEEEKQCKEPWHTPQETSLRRYRTLCINNIPPGSRPEQLVEHFSRFGSVNNVYLPPITTGPALHGYVEFESVEDAERALQEASAAEFGGRPLFLRWSVDKFFFEKLDSAGQVYIKNLPYSVTEADLRRRYADFGEIVDVRLPEDLANNGAAGFAFVAFKSMESVVRAVEATNGTCFGKRIITVEVGKRTRGPSYQLPNRKERVEPEKHVKRLEVVERISFRVTNTARVRAPPRAGGHVYITNLPYTVTEADLRRCYADFGEIMDVRLPVDLANNGAAGFAFVTFKSMESAVRAVEATNGTSFGNQIITVKVSKQARGLCYRLLNRKERGKHVKRLEVVEGFPFGVSDTARVTAPPRAPSSPPARA